MTDAERYTINVLVGEKGEKDDRVTYFLVVYRTIVDLWSVQNPHTDTPLYESYTGTNLAQVLIGVFFKFFK